MTFSVDDRWSIDADVLEDGLLHLTVYCAEGEMFCGESAQMRLESQKLQIMLASFSSTNHECALPDIQTHEGSAS
jgi:hypothetical protein